MNRIKLPSQQELNDRFIYKDGQLYVKALYDYLAKNNKDLLGTLVQAQPVGYINSRGYQLISIGGTSYVISRLIYKMFTGEEPECVDHKDGNPRNNKLENLRGCSESQNLCNKSVYSTNKLGIKNIRIHSYDKNGLPNYQVEIDLAGKTTAKLFKSLAKAVLFRNKKLKEIHGEFARYG